MLVGVGNAGLDESVDERGEARLTTVPVDGGAGGGEVSGTLGGLDASEGGDRGGVHRGDHRREGAFDLTIGEGVVAVWGGDDDTEAGLVGWG